MISLTDEDLEYLLPLLRAKVEHLRFILRESYDLDLPVQDISNELGQALKILSKLEIG